MSTNRVDSGARKLFGGISTLYQNVPCKMLFKCESSSINSAERFWPKFDTQIAKIECYFLFITMKKRPDESQ